ncbi:MAG TPA: hypothetical protein VMV20_07195 [Chitinophagaceae bacterium]|nr:hypothetical protein [Chitinophagaceae bacterium]
MKPNIKLTALALSLFAGGCTTVYESGQTPDDVYYSPASQATSGYGGDGQNTSSVQGNSDSSNYITYNDNGNSYNSPYNSSYNQPAYYPDYFMPYYSSYPYMSSFGFGYPYYSGLSFDYGFGCGYPGYSLGLGFGYPYYSGFNDPYFGYSPYFSPYYLGGAYLGKGGLNYNAAPSTAYGPRYGAGSRASLPGYGGTTYGSRTPGGATLRTFPQGTIAPQNNRTIYPGYTPRRTFRPTSGEMPAGQNIRPSGIRTFTPVYRNTAPAYRSAPPVYRSAPPAFRSAPSSPRSFSGSSGGGGHFSSGGRRR